MTGRPTKLTDDITRAVCESLEEGLSIGGSCARAGIARSTYHDWVKRGTDGEDEFSDFAVETARARARVEERLLESVEWAAGERIRMRALGSGESMEVVEDVERDWRAAAWLLERKFPDEYGNRVQVDQHTTGAIDIHLPAGAGDAAIEFVQKLGDATDSEAAA